MINEMGQNNLFRGLNGQRNKEKRTYGSHLEKKTTKQIKKGKSGRRMAEEEISFFFLVFILLVFFLRFPSF